MNREGLVPRSIASAVLAISIVGPALMLPCALLDDEEWPLLPPVQWFFFLAAGAACFAFLGKWRGPLVRHLDDIAVMACMVVFPLRGFWVDARLPALIDPKRCEDIESLSIAFRSPRLLAMPYLASFIVAYVAATVGYFACRSARKRAPRRLPSPWSAGLLLLGMVQASLASVQMAGDALLSILVPIARGVAWCPVVGAFLFGRELALLVAAVSSSGRAAGFVRRASVSVLVVAALAVGVPAAVFRERAAAWSVFSKTVGAVFSALPEPECDPSARR